MSETPEREEMNVVVNGWTFDPTDETWFAKTGPNTWSIVKGALDDPPSWRPTAK